MTEASPEDYIPFSTIAEYEDALRGALWPELTSVDADGQVIVRTLLCPDCKALVPPTIEHLDAREGHIGWHVMMMRRMSEAAVGKATW